MTQPRLRATLASGLALATLAGSAATAPSPTAASPSSAAPSGSRAADSLSGRVTAAQGKWRHDAGRVSIRLSPRAGGRTRHLTLRLTGARCAAHTRCLDLQGKLSGTITMQPTKPDVGQRFSIKASGTITPLGHASASGFALGTGSIARGRVTLRLTLSTAHGKVTVSAASAPVPSFTSP